MGLRLTRLNAVTGLLAVLVIGLLLLILFANILVTAVTKRYQYADIQSIPYNRVGLLLGTSKYARAGGINDHYRLRLQAALALFKAGKIQYILISGDNSSPYYDEPSTIRNDLIRMGIPEQYMYKDDAGLRTIDSIIRAQLVFGLDRFTIISQGYLNNRALYIANNQNINAVAFNAGTGLNTDLTNRGREILARVLAVLELHLLYKEPKYKPAPLVSIGVTPPQ